MSGSHPEALYCLVVTGLVVVSGCIGKPIDNRAERNQSAPSGISNNTKVSARNPEASARSEPSTDQNGPSEKDLFPRELVQFEPYPKNPLFAGTGNGSWDHKIRERGCILRHDGKWHLWYTGYRGERLATKKLGYATSDDGLNWKRHPDNPIFEESWTEDMHVVRQDKKFYMVAEGRNDIPHLLISSNGVKWDDQGRLDVRMTDGSPISKGPYGTPTLWFEDKKWYLFYERRDDGIWLATSTDLKVWTNVSDDPVIATGPSTYDKYAVALNQVIRYRDRYYGVYHANGDSKRQGPWTTCIAVSDDLKTWKKYSGNPIVRTNDSSGQLVHDGKQFRLYTTHPDVKVYFPAGSKSQEQEKTTSLFNGKDLEGWYADVPKADKDKSIKPSFVVRDGKLVSMGVPRGHLITKNSFKNYRLEVQYRFANKPGNCGVLVHTDGKRPRVLYEMFPASLEVQMQHKAAGDFWCIHEDIKVPNMEKRRKGPKENWGGKKGQSRHIKNLTDDSEKPLGEWNTMIIECLSDKIRVWVNGDLVNDGYECTAKEGQISLQAEGAEVEFRKLELTPIEALTEAKDLKETKSNDSGNDKKLNSDKSKN